MSGADPGRHAAVIVGCAAQRLTEDERRFFTQADPLGFILFGRNIANPNQVRTLVAEMRETVGRDDAPVLIDQEGGRVARLKPPHWPEYPPAATFGKLLSHNRRQAARAARLGARLIAHDLAELGINVDCLPVLDVPAQGSHEIVGDRAYATKPEDVAFLGREVCTGMLDGGVLPVIKHIPGHGRAKADSHLELPEVTSGIDELRAVDFVPFKALSDAPCGMTAHVLFHAIDPGAPVTVSKIAIDQVIRGEIGFDGLLFTDDISMEALSGTVAERAVAALAAGCDIVLHCNGNIEEARAVTGVAGKMSDATLSRWLKAKDRPKQAPNTDVQALHGELQELLAAIAD